MKTLQELQQSLHEDAPTNSVGTPSGIAPPAADNKTCTNGPKVKSRKDFDFSKMFTRKAGQKLKEEAEQIDELSKDTLNSYKNKASVQVMKAADAVHDKPLPEKFKIARKVRQRSKGIQLAKMKMRFDEQVEAVSEVKKVQLPIHRDDDTAGEAAFNKLQDGLRGTKKYRHKEKKADPATAGNQIANALRKAVEHNADKPHTIHNQEGHEVAKAKNVHQARQVIDLLDKRMKKPGEHWMKPVVKEEVEHLDELNKETLANYVNKADVDKNKREANLPKTGGIPRATYRKIYTRAQSIKKAGEKMDDPNYGNAKPAAEKKAAPKKTTAKKSADKKVVPIRPKKEAPKKSSGGGGDTKAVMDRYKGLE